VLVDARTYTIKPGCTPAHVKIYQELGFAAQVRHLGQPLCYLTAESGEINTILHCWAYESAADRETRRAAMAKDPDWQKYLAANREAGYLLAQRTTLMTPVSFVPLKR
jgi:hypothetical protein